MSQYTDHEDAVRILKEIEKNPSNYLFIHYSCESFIDIKDGRTPRITSIAIRHIKTGQTESFSLHKVAEQAGESIDKLHERYDIIERKRLDSVDTSLCKHICPQRYAPDLNSSDKG